MIAKKNFGGFRARLLSGASMAAVLAVGITVGMGGASPAMAVELAGNAGAGTRIADDAVVTTTADGKYGFIDMRNGGDGAHVAGVITINHLSTLYVSNSNAVGDQSTWAELTIAADKTLNVILGATVAGAAGNGGSLILNGIVGDAGGSLNVKGVVGGGGANGVSSVKFTKAISLKELTIAAGAGGPAVGSLLTIANVEMASKVETVTFSGGAGAEGVASVGGALVITQHTGAWTGETLTISGGVGGKGLDGNAAPSGVGGAVTITAFAGAMTATDRVRVAGGAGGKGGDGSAGAAGGAGGIGGAILAAAVGGAIKGNVEIAGGAGGAGGKAFAANARAGGAGGAGGAVTAITMGGLITGDLTIASGDAGGGGEASANAVGGHGAAGGAVTVTDVTDGVVGNVIITSGAGSNGGAGNAGFVGGASAAGGVVTVMDIHRITGGLTVTSGAGGSGALATAVAGAGGGDGGAITLTELASDAAGIGGDVSITTGGGGAAGDGALGNVGGVGGAGGAIVVTDITGKIAGSVTLTTGAGGVGGSSASAQPGLAGGAAGAITVTEISNIGKGLTATAGSGGIGGAATAGGGAGGIGGVGGAITVAPTDTDITGDVSLTAGSGGTGGAGTGGAGTGGKGGDGGKVEVTLNADDGNGDGNSADGDINGNVELRAGSGGNGGDAEEATARGGEGGDGGDVTLTVSGDIVGTVLLDDGDVGSKGGGDVDDDDRSVGGAKGEATLVFNGDDAAQKVTGAITVGADGEGTIKVLNGGNTITFEAAIGQAMAGETPAVKLGTLEIGASGGAGAKATFKESVSAGAITVGGTALVAVAEAVFEKDVTFSELDIVASIGNVANTTVIAKGNLIGDTIIFTDAAGNGSSILTLDGTTAQTVSAEIKSSARNTGILKVNNDVTFQKNIGGHSNNRLELITVALGKTMTLDGAREDGARKVGATAFNIVGEDDKVGATLSLTGPLTLGAGTVLDLATAGKATLKLAGSFVRDGATVINAKALRQVDDTATVNLSGDSVTVVLPATFTGGTLTLIDFGATDGTANDDASKFKVSDNFLASYAIAAASADGDVTLTATPVEAAKLATDLGITVDAANAVKSASAALSDAEDAVAQAAYNAMFVKVPADATDDDKKAAKDAAEQLQPSPSTAGAIVSLLASTGAASLGVSSSRLAALRGGSAFASTAATSGFAAGEGAMAKSVWLKPFANMGKQKRGAKSSIAGFTTKTAGIAFGADITTSKNVTLGAAVSYAASKINSKDVSKADARIKSYQLAVYGGYATDKWYVEAMAAYAKNKIDTTRKIDFGGLDVKAKGKYDADQYMLRVGGGMPIAVGSGGAFVTPTLGFQWSRVPSKTYTETGAGGLSLKVKSGDVDTRLVTAGVRLHKSFKKVKWTVVPEVRAGLIYNFSDDQAVSTSTFTGGGASALSFKTKGAKAEKFGGVVGAGLTFMMKKNVSLAANYDLNLKKGFVGHSGVLQLRLNF